MARRYALFVVLGAIVISVPLTWLSYSLSRRATTSSADSVGQQPMRVADNSVQKEIVSTASTKTGKDASSLSPKDLEAMAIVYADDRLKTWLENWAARHGRDAPPDASELNELKGILDQSPLSAGELMTVAHGFNKKADAPVIVRDIYHAAAMKMDRELSQPTNAPSDHSDAATAFIKNRQNIKDVLWPLIDGRGDPIALDALYRFYFDFIKIGSQKPKDRRMQAVVQAVRIGLAECYYLKGEYDAALPLIEESDKEPLSRDRRMSLEWIWGLVLFSTHQYGEAIPHLEKVANNPDFHELESAKSILIQAQCAQGNVDEASREYEAFVHSGHPSNDRVSLLKEKIAEARNRAAKDTK